MNENTDTQLEARIVLRLILNLVQNVTSTVFDLHFCWNIERYTKISNEERCTFATSFPPLLLVFNSTTVSKKSSICQGVCGNTAQGQYAMSDLKDGHTTLSVSGIALTD